jgi:hypothetical protein
MLQFLEQKCHKLKSIERRNTGTRLKVTSSTPTSSYWQSKKTSRTEAFAATMLVNHRWNVWCAKKLIILISQCSECLALTNKARWAQVKRSNYCTNCLSSQPTRKSCRAGTCRECRQKHHSLLHQPQLKAESQLQPTATLTSRFLAATTTYTVTSQQILLSTVVLVTYNSVGTPYHCRAILNSGSQSNFITENLAHC